MSPQQGQGRQISFAQELWRKGLHMVALAIPVGYQILGLSRSEALAIMVPITLVTIAVDIARLRHWALWTKVARRIFGRMIRPHERKGDFTGATYILTTACLTIALYQKPVAVAALAFVVIGDSLAAVVGRRWGRHRFGHKSWEGSLACLAGTILVSACVPGLSWPVGLLGALVATVVEALPLGVDDNVSIPIVSGLIMSLTRSSFFNL